MTAPDLGGDYPLGQAMVHGLAQMVYFFFVTPPGWLADWLILEGFVRVFSGVAGETLGTAPLTLARFVLACLRPKS